MTKSAQPGPRPQRQQSLVNEIRRRIIQGDYLPGSRLPSRLELAEQLGYSSITIQRALDQLAHEGFVISRPRAGTFVSETPPHLFRYGLVLSCNTSDPRGWESSRFAMVLYQQAMALQATEGLRFNVYLGVNGRPDSEDYQRLTADVQAGRLAGCIVDVPWICEELLGSSTIPAVGFSGNGDPVPNMTVFSTSPSEWVNRALDHLASRQRRRLAVIVNARCHGEEVTRIQEAARARHMVIEPRWFQGVEARHSRWARPCVHQLLHSGQDQRPDALLITDDTLADHALGGLLDAGVRVPDDVDVVSHCNFPWPAPAMLPIKRLGIDVHAALRQCIDLIDRSRRSEAVPAAIALRPIFEDEFTSDSQALSPMLEYAR